MRPPRPFGRYDFEDLSTELEADDELTVTRQLDPDSEEVTRELEPEDADVTLLLDSDSDLDALFQDDLTPTTVAPAKAAAMRWPLRAGLPPPPALPRPPPAPPGQSAVLYAAPRPLPASRPPFRGNSPSIAPVMLAAPPSAPTEPSRAWPVVLGAALVGCAALAAASIPLILKGAAFQEAATSAYIAAATAPGSALPKRAAPRATSAATGDAESAEVVSIDDLPLTRSNGGSAEVVSIDDLPLTRSKGGTPALDEAGRRSANAVPSRERVATKRVPQPAPAKHAAEPRAVASSAAAILLLTAVPPVSVVVDGRPLGLTPRRVKVNPGAHTIVFAGPDGRVVRHVNLTGGAEKTLTAGF